LLCEDASRTDTVRGKPSYLAPEQLRGERIDRRTDVFSLGITAYEALTGKRLFARDTIAESHVAILEHRCADPRDACSAVPETIASVIVRSLAPNALDRFDSARAMRAELLRAAAIADVAVADEAEVAAWVRESSPPSAAEDDLEREILW